jgi:hypothetical protein
MRQRSLGAVRTHAHKLSAPAVEIARVGLNRRRHRPAPPTDGLVLEVGSGQAPHPRSDVVVDKYPDDDFERGAPLSFAKPLVVADGHHLPFADDSFAYEIAAHVLEHATDPLQFAGELSRVAAAGFVQVPTREGELVYGWPFHPWLIDLEGGVLVFWPRGDARAPAGEFMHREFLDSPLVQLAFAARRSRWHHSVRWRSSLAVRVEGSSTAEQTASFDPDRVLAALRSMSTPALPLAVVSALRCPACHSALMKGASTMSCTGCERRYPVVGNVPALVAELDGTT